MQSKLAIAGRGAEFLVGAVFVVAAVLKAQNINLFIGQILAYQIFTSTGALTAVALITLALETFLGLSLMLGSPWRRGVLATSLAMLVFFSLIIAYAWQFHGLKDCGCFGKVSMTPPQAILKNVVLIAMLIFAWYGLARRGSEAAVTSYLAARKLVPALLAVVLCAVAYPQLGGAAPVAPPETASNLPASPEAKTPAQALFAGYRIVPEYGDAMELARGEYLVALLSMTCEHCMATVPTLNEYTYESALPPLVAICLEENDGDMENFQAMTGPLFPMHSIGLDMLTWSKLGDGSLPPQLCYIRDGVVLERWKDEMPSQDDLLALVAPPENAESAETPQ